MVAVKAPGFGLKVDGKDARPRFPNAISGWRSNGVPVREQRMLAFIDRISDKPNWETKVFDETILAKWREEASARPEDLNGDVVLSEEMFDFCIKELQDKAETFKKTGLVNIYDSEVTIVKSDTAVSEDLRQSLIQAVKVLEDVPDHKRTGTPARRGPSSTCSILRSSRGRQKEYGSFQWLPTDVELTDSGAKFLGYVNNLHPERHAEVVKVLEKMVDAALPLWNESLSGYYLRPRIDLAGTGSDDWCYPEGLKYQIPGREGPMSCHFYDWKTSNRILVYREPRAYEPQASLPKTHCRDLEDLVTDLKKQSPDNTIQVIVKLANIELTPENPHYAGGSWHVEGALNEGICATAIYYYEQDNITDSHLRFRQGLDAEEIIMLPEQNEYESLERFLGVEQEGSAVQELGEVLTRESRMLVFPNCMQHQVQPFELQDPTRPGRRKILAMFLIDPNRPVLSTCNVPPQRRDWWADEVRRQNALDKLPAELFDHTVGLVDDFPISWEKALEYREKLMEERSNMNDKVTDEIISEAFSFCEH
ncbi:unnamed protein product [Parascedosporium putredinis]|uniref:Duf1665 domain containing protein n=1 Tax=Parascedosporium putredinis TaxID=1442378 RepID=A0A9P1GVY4_9PEZI|nr:unnamed protein product [Parascedosporium putredinis]CAI7988947.1 unnamed protein product [Parascedosporium putredinis]